MKLTVLGCYGTCPGMNGACSGYLIQHENLNILLDCGSGTLSRVQRYCKIEDIDAIFLSHLHFDHIADIFSLKYALETKKYKGEDIENKKLFFPKTNPEIVKELCDNKVFDIDTLKQNTKVVIGNLKFSFVEMTHLIESYAVIIECGKKKIVYSGDTGYNEKLVKAAYNADLFLCESTFLETNNCSLNHHMSAGGAGRIASQADVKQLLLTHFWYEEEKQQYLSEAKKYFSNVHLAKELTTYYIGI